MATQGPTPPRENPGAGPRVAADADPDGDRPLRTQAESLVLLEGLASRVMDALTGGVVLAGLALSLGASNMVFGVVAALPFLAQVAQLPAVAILVRVQDRRLVAVAFTALARGFLLLVALLAATHRLDVTALILLVAGFAAATVVSTAAWNTWMRDSMETARLGRFFAFRGQAMTIVGSLALVAAGWFLDRNAANPQEAEAAYAWLYLAGAAFGAVSVWLLWRTPQPAHPTVPTRARRAALLQIRDAFRLPGSGRMSVALGLVSCSLAVALPFTAVYLLRGLGYGFGAVTGFAIASQVAYIVGLRAWGSVSDRLGDRPTLQVASAILVVALAGWCLAGSITAWPAAYLVALHLLTGLAVGGLELMTGNLLLKSAPAGNAAPYLAALSLARAGAAGVATLLAGWLWEVVGPGIVVQGRIAGLTFTASGFTVLAIASVALAIAATLALASLPEGRATRIPEVVRAMRREVLSLSTVAGLRSFAHAGTFIVESIRRRRRTPGTAPPIPAASGPPPPATEPPT